MTIRVSFYVIHLNFSQAIMKILNLIIFIVNVIYFQYVAVTLGMNERYLKHPDAKRHFENLSDVLEEDSHPHILWAHYGRDILAMNDDLQYMIQTLHALNEPWIKDRYRKLIENHKQELIETLQKQESNRYRRLSYNRERYVLGSAVEKGKELLKNMGIHLNDGKGKMIYTAAPSGEQFLLESQRKISILRFLEDAARKECLNGRKEFEDRLQRLRSQLANAFNDESLVKRYDLPPYPIEFYKAEDEWERRKIEEFERFHKGKDKV